MDGHWEEFAPEANEQMLQAYLDYVREIPGTQFVTISSGGVERQVDFKLMQQKHLRTKKKLAASVLYLVLLPIGNLPRKNAVGALFTSHSQLLRMQPRNQKKNLTGAKIKI